MVAFVGADGATSPASPCLTKRRRYEQKQMQNRLQHLLATSSLWTGECCALPCSPAPFKEEHACNRDLDDEIHCRPNARTRTLHNELTVRASQKDRTHRVRRAECAASPKCTAEAIDWFFPRMAGRPGCGVGATASWCWHAVAVGEAVGGGATVGNGGARADE